jgi:hypothetical protein
MWKIIDSIIWGLIPITIGLLMVLYPKLFPFRNVSPAMRPYIARTSGMSLILIGLLFIALALYVSWKVAR